MLRAFYRKSALLHISRLENVKKQLEDFRGGSMDKNPPANVGDTGSIPGLGRFHMPRTN